MAALLGYRCCSSELGWTHLHWQLSQVTPPAQPPCRHAAHAPRCQLQQPHMMAPLPPCRAAAPLEGIPPDTWVALDRVLVVKDIFTGGVRTFLDRRDAHLYRKILYAQVGAEVVGVGGCKEAVVGCKDSGRRWAVRIVTAPDCHVCWD